MANSGGRPERREIKLLTEEGIAHTFSAPAAIATSPYTAHRQSFPMIRNKSTCPTDEVVPGMNHPTEQRRKASQEQAMEAVGGKRAC